MQQHEPFLPAMAPDPSTTAAHAKPKQSAKKTLLVWVVFIAFFVALYQFFAPPPGSRRAREEAPACETTWQTAALPWGTMIVVVGLAGWWFVRQMQRNNEYVRDQEDASLAFLDGNWAVAIEKFTVLAKKYHGHSGRLFAEYQVGHAKLNAGDLDGALAAAIESEKQGGLFAKGIRTRGAIFLAQLYALRGDITTAQKWLDDARQRLATNRTERFHPAALAQIADVTIACRREDFEAALATLDREQKKLDALLSVDVVVETWVLRAFALHALADTRSVGKLEPVLSLLRARPRGSFDYLAIEWPALRDFLSAYDLLAPGRGSVGS